MSEYDELRKTYHLSKEEIQAVINLFNSLAEIGIESINNLFS